MCAFPIFKQKDVYDCGPACLKIVLEYFNKNRSYEEIIKGLISQAKIHADGVFIIDLVSMLNEFGFKAMPVKLKFKAIQHHLIDFPFIALWKKKHYVVVFDYHYKRVVVSDPMLGIVKYTNKEFLKDWLWEGQFGIAILLEKR